MQSAYTHPQAPGQYPLAFNSECSRGVPHTSAPESMTSSFAQGMPSYHNAQSHTRLDTYRDPTLVNTVPAFSNNVYEGAIRGHDPNNDRAESWEPQPSQPPNHGVYTMPNVQYGSVRPTGANWSTDPPAIVQLPRHTMTFPPLLSAAHTEPNIQAASLLWCLGDCRVSYASHDELHLTIVLKKSPPA